MLDVLQLTVMIAAGLAAIGSASWIIEHTLLSGPSGSGVQPADYQPNV